MRTGILYGPVQEDIARVEATFESLKQVDYAPLAEMLGMILGGGGKLLRPALTLLAGRFGAYDLDLLVPLAASVELLHTASLVHDDVIDSADTRRGRRNEPAYLVDTVKHIAELRGDSFEEVASRTALGAAWLFGLGDIGGSEPGGAK